MLARDFKELFQVRHLLPCRLSCSAPRPGNEEETEEQVQHHNAGIDEEGEPEIHPKKDRAELPREGAHPVYTAEQGNRSPAIRYRDHIRHVGMARKHPQSVSNASE